jgi:hypothetical protein
MDVFVEIKYFNTDVGICADDFKNTDRTTYLNPNLISEVSDVSTFTTPFGGKEVEKYFTIHMNNKRCYFCRESEFGKVKKRIQ